ncbi:tellurite resistance TerB family protein [Bordetella genomosp. 12]|uniref:tellurite resistance TerB family protein n=1 Tax=Bordetella genomosp. 12 TaxID=463035 RepID=UPI000B9DDB13|nr:tellurite resistance TerB family protein [Bordetella genomosp. 12]
MSARQLLDQLLRSGQDLARQAAEKVPGQQAGQGSALLAGLGGGALGAGALGLLLGSKKARKIGGKVAAYGGMAALGALAYRAYGQWQENQARDAQSAPPATPHTPDRLPAPHTEAHSNAVLAAMIGAAKADGHIGAEERQQLEDALTRLSGDNADRQWLHAELARPVDPAAVARTASSPEMAAEMYLASLLVIDEQSYMERAYLDELARQLKLPPGLQQQLQDQVAQLS